ncbi:prepilin peptidase [Crenobacter sp. SG2303]|uniref:Prepilin peptidase n=1 Tax=Crenobacter oryzisoli TaxID=3056844 RepID=A0ABT7XTI8_9NEIS|nr:prepilin peptidase [Crenobacter sp. SG2303]MDN0077115.1 prepilin peptidase [Crenobacter sp. SG2303]
MQGLAAWEQACFLLLLGAVAVFDFVQRRVPNKLLGVGGIVAIILLLVNHPGGTAWLVAISGLAVGLFAFLPFYFMGLMGAGDVKFFAVIGLWLGVSALLPVWVVASVMAGFQAFLWLALSVGLRGKGEQYRFSFQIKALRLNEIPYASYLAISAGLVAYYPELFKKLYIGVAYVL